MQQSNFEGGARKTNTMEKDNDNKDSNTPLQGIEKKHADDSKPQGEADTLEAPQQSAEETKKDDLINSEEQIKDDDDQKVFTESKISEPSITDESSKIEKEENGVDPTKEGGTTKDEEKTINEKVVDEKSKSEQVENQQIEKLSNEPIGEEKKDEGENKPALLNENEKETINPTKDEILEGNVEQEATIAGQHPTENTTHGDESFSDNNRTNASGTEADKVYEIKSLENMAVGISKDKEIDETESSENLPGNSNDKDIGEIKPSDVLPALSKQNEVEETESVSGSNTEEKTKTQSDHQDQQQQHIDNESLKNILDDASEILGTDNGTPGQVEDEPDLNFLETPNENNNIDKKADDLSATSSGKDFNMNDITKDLPESHSTEESMLLMDDKEEEIAVDDLLNEENDDEDILTNDLLTRELPQQNAPNVEAMAYESEYLTRKIQEGRDAEKHLHRTVEDKQQQLEEAERKIKDLQIRLIRFARDDEAKDRHVASLEKELKDINKQLEEVLDEHQQKVEQQTQQKQPTRSGNDISTKANVKESKTCTIL